jgi:nitrate reductase NapAB chaperone NapD
MAICGYLVFSETGAGPALSKRLAALPGCDVVPAKNRDLLLLVTDSQGVDEETALRERVEQLEGVSALVLTFGEVDPDTSLADPLAKGRRLPVFGS